MTTAHRLRAAMQAFAVAAALAACGGGGGGGAGGDGVDAPPPTGWSEPVLLAQTPGHIDVTVQRDPSGAWTAAWSAVYPVGATFNHISGWLHRTVEGAWSTLPGLPVRFLGFNTKLAAFVTSPEGPLGALVFSDGHRLEDGTRVSSEYFAPFIRVGDAWQGQPEITPGILEPACVQPFAPAGEALCLLSDPVNSHHYATGLKYQDYPRPAVLRFKPAQGWTRTDETLDMGADETAVGAKIELRSLAMNPAGDALAVWERGPGIDGVPNHTAYHLYQPATGWGPLGTLPDVGVANRQRPGANADQDETTRQGPALAAGAGSFMVPHVACTPSPALQDVELSCAPAITRYTPSGGWQTHELASRVTVRRAWNQMAGVYVDDPLIRPPELHLGAVGQVLALWWSGPQQWSRVFHPQQGWGATMAGPSGDADAKTLAARVDDDGRALIVLDRYGVMRYSPQTGWSTIAPLPVAATLTSYKWAMIDAQGNVILLWKKSTAPDYTNEIFTAQFQP